MPNSSREAKLSRILESLRGAIAKLVNLGSIVGGRGWRMRGVWLPKLRENMSRWIKFLDSDSRALRELESLLEIRRREVAAEWNRSLPFGDHFSDRFARARELGFGSGSSIYDSCLVLGEVAVGKGTWVGPFVILDGSGGLSIGHNCSIAAGAQIYSHDTVELSGRLDGDAVPKSPVTIGDNVYIGPNVVVARGVSIGEGAVIGANSFVNSDIPPRARAWGNPAVVQEVKSE